MSENVAQTLDMQQHSSGRVDAKLDQNTSFDAVMASIADLKAQYAYHWQLIISLSERVAVLESRHQ